MRRKKKKCITPHCRKTPHGYNSKCSRCYMRTWAQNNPVKYAFSKLKFNAQRRGKAFELSLQEFIEFCDETNYIELRGRTADSMTIDRIDSRLGYSRDNIRIMRHSDNDARGAAVGDEDDSLVYAGAVDGGPF